MSGETSTVPEFDEWAIVDLFGHQRIAGKVSNQTIGGSTFVRVDVYDGSEVEFTRLFNPSAIYAISPVSKNLALAAAKAIDAKPVQPYELPSDRVRQLAGRRYGTEDE